jgi:hypothetical protein
MPHDEEKAKALQDAHQKANEALEEAKASFAFILENEPDLTKQLVRVLISNEFGDVATEIQKYLEANKAHIAASDAYLAALSQK